MEQQERWERFTQTGKVSDYLAYTNVCKTEEQYQNCLSEVEKENREGTSDGNGSFGNSHW